MVGFLALNEAMLVRLQLPELVRLGRQRQTILAQNEECCGFESHPS
jgi:hypothetical protein